MGRKNYNTKEERKAAHAASMKRWYEKNKETQLAYMKQRYADNRETILEQVKQYQLSPVGRAVNLVGAYKQNDIKYKRGKCTITAAWIVENVFSGQVCHYCGETDWTKLGCDRIDNSKPHTPENCVPCCDACNAKKARYTYEEYINKINKKENVA